MSNEPIGTAAPEQSLLELVQRAAQGDEAAVNLLLAEIRPYLKDEVAKQAGDVNRVRVDLSGVVQECLVAVWQKASEVHGSSDAQVHAWLKAIARNEFLTAVRHAQQQKRDRRREEQLAQDSGGTGQLAAATPTPSKVLTQQEEDTRREEALAQLSADDQQVLRLRLYEAKEWSEIAARMERSEDAVKRLYFRAAKRWKEKAGEA